MKKLLLFGAAFSAAYIFGGAAIAQVYMAQADWADPYYRVGPPMSRPLMMCRKLCASDLSPCDPIYFKTADGRCAGILNR
jgi:hypothetical protein